MKLIFCLFGIFLLAAFVLGPISVFAQTPNTREQERIAELQAMVAQLLRLIADLQKQILTARQASMPAVFGCAQAEITWAGVSGASEYLLYRNNLEVYRGKDLKFLDQGLMPGTTYAYTVRARNEGGVSPASPVQTMTTPPQCAPSAPFIFAREGLQCGGSIQVSWSQAQGAHFYEVFRGDALIFSGSVFSFTDRGLTPGQAYSYKVRAGNTGGVGQFSQPTSAKASIVCPPTAPTTPTVKDPFSDSVAKEARFDLAIPGSPSGATAQSGGGAVNVLRFQASAKLSRVVIDRVDVDFSDRPWLFLSSVELRDGGNTASKIDITQDSFVQAGDSLYRLRFANVAIVVPEGGSKDISVRVVAKQNLLLAQPRELTVSIPVNGVHGKDEVGVPHNGPDAQKASAFTKTFFVKRP